MKEAENKKQRAARTRSAEALDRFHEEKRIDPKYDFALLLRLVPFVRPHARLLVSSVFFLIVASGLALVRPLLIRHAFDAFDTPDAKAVLMRTGIVLSCLLVVEQSISFPQMYFMQKVGAHAMADLRVHVFQFLHTRKIAFFDKTPVGRLVTRVTNNVDAIGEMFASGALNAIGDLIRLVAIVIVMLSLDTKLALLAFAAVPPVAIGVRYTRARIRDAFREVSNKTARMNAFLNEQVSGMAVIQAYAREAQAAQEFDVINDAYRRANNRSIVFDATLDAAIEMVSSICIAAVLWYAGVRALSSNVRFGTLFAFVAYIEMFFVPIRDLSTRYTLLQSAMSGAERVFELLDNRDIDGEMGVSVPVEEQTTAPNAFELDGVTFEYKPGHPVLHDVSIAARLGEKVALVGATGSGKSTLSSLLLRLYEVNRGTVRVMGRDVRTLSRQELRRQFSVVPQDVFLFPGTVASNIAAGETTVDVALVRRALERIGALDLFLQREGGLDAPVLERGHNFSAGERQLIAFARALYRDPPILLLDEATANIDSDTEARLKRALEGATHGRTALIIAHRLSTVRAADRIIVLHHGRVIEQGTHDELLGHDGVYARLHKLQFARAPQTDGAREVDVA